MILQSENSPENDKQQTDNYDEETREYIYSRIAYYAKDDWWVTFRYSLSRTIQRCRANRFILAQARHSLPSDASPECWTFALKGRCFDGTIRGGDERYGTNDKKYRTHRKVSSLMVISDQTWQSFGIYFNRIEAMNRGQKLYHLIIPIVESNQAFNRGLFIKIQKSDFYSESTKQISQKGYNKSSLISELLFDFVWFELYFIFQQIRASGGFGHDRCRLQRGEGRLEKN